MHVRAAFFLLILASTCFAEERLELKGRVVDFVGAVVAEARVNLAASDGKYIAPRVTGADGSFRMSDLRPGTYVLSVKSRGFDDYEQKIVLSQSSTMEVRLQPSPSAWDSGDIADLYAHLKAITGDDSVDCGDISPPTDPSAASHCALDALAKRKPFRVVYHLQGIDSEIAVGIAFTSSGKGFAAHFDSIGLDASGTDSSGKFSAKNHILTYPCPTPVRLRLTKNARVSCFSQKDHSPAGVLMSDL